MTTWETIRNELQKKEASGNVVGLNNNRGYHIEFSFDNIDQARELCDELAEHDIFAKLTTTASNDAFRVYIKDSDSICNLLALAHVNKSLLALHDKIALRSVRNTVNRRANCDTANISKQISKAQQQIKIINELEHIPQDLKSTAEARVANPSASYGELAKVLGISKAGVAHRLNRLCTRNQV